MARTAKPVAPTPKARTDEPTDWRQASPDTDALAPMQIVGRYRHARRWIDPPCLDVSPVPAASVYEVLIAPMDGAQPVSRQRDSHPRIDLQPIWSQLPYGPLQVTGRAWDGDGRLVGLAPLATFNRSPDWDGRQDAPLDYRATGCGVIEYLVRHAPEASAHPGMPAYLMMAENYRYLDEVELLKRLHDAGRFGDLYYGAGEYLHDCRDLWYDEAGGLTWRGRGLLGVYCTHSLGPLLYVTGDRVATVSALAVPGGKFDSRVLHPTMHLMQMVTTGGVTLRVRVDHVSPRPHRMAYYALQGTAGAAESWRGGGDSSKAWFADEHEPSTVSGGAVWHPLAEQAPRYLADRQAAPAGARAGGHGTSEYWLLRDFLAAVRGEAPVPIDVYRSLDYTLPGILAVTSADATGAPQPVPDPRAFEA